MKIQDFDRENIVIYDVDNIIINERNKEIQEIHTQMKDVNEIFNKLNILVLTQNESIDHIANNITIADKHVKDGTKDLEKAEKSASKNNTLLAILGLISTVVVATVTSIVIIFI